MKKLFLLLLTFLSLISCSNSKDTYNKAIIYGMKPNGEVVQQEVDGPFKVDYEPTSHFTRIFNRNYTVGVEYFSDQVEDNKLKLLNTFTGSNNKMMWRQNKGHNIGFEEKKDTLKFSFYDENSENPVKCTFMFIK